MGSVQCGGRETRLAGCTYQNARNLRSCSHSEDAGVHCLQCEYCYAYTMCTLMGAWLKCITSSLQLPQGELESSHKVQQLWTFPGLHLLEHRDIFWDTISPVWVQAYHGQIKQQTTWHFLRLWLVCTLTHDTSAAFQPSPPQLREQEPAWAHAHLSQVGSQISKCLCPFINMLLLCTLFSTHCCSTECNGISNWF